MRREGSSLDAVVTHHRDGFRSGVARFNELLAKHLDLPLLGLDDPADALSHPLLSFKFSELGRAAEGAVAALTSSDRPFELFLHEVAGSDLERQAVATATHVHCGNHAVHRQIRRRTRHCSVAWTPGLLCDDRPLIGADLTVFSFGMAHKIHSASFRRLRALLDASGRGYMVYVSAANHETASLRDAELVFREMEDIFPRELLFLGNLSDLVVSHYLRHSTFYAAFFQEGVRANNTSVASAMERGAVVITNLDADSPPEFVHLDNLLDLNRCEQLPSDPLVLRRLGLRAMETARARGWAALADHLNRSAEASG